MREFVIAQKTANDFVKNQFYNLKTKVEQGQKNHQAAIQDLETKFGRISDHQSSRPLGTMPSNTQTNPKPSTSNEKPYRPPPARNEYVNAIFTRGGKTYNPPANPNTKTAIFLDDSKDEAEEVKKEAEPLPKKPTQTDTPPLKAFEYLALADLGASINLMPYSLYAALSSTTLKPKRMSIRLANHTYQYPMGVAENMLVQVGKFMFPVDFVIIVKNKELNLRIGEDRSTFHIDKAMQHSHMNDNTCFCMDVIDEITNDELDDLLDDSKPFLNTSKKISETPLDKEFDEFMSGNIQEDEVKDNFEELPPKDELRIRTSIQDPPTDLKLKPLPKHLEYAFLEENSLLLVVISALLKQNEMERLVSVLNNHKEAFAWKTSDIPRISPSFCKHKINFEDDAKQVIQRQRRLNPNMKEVIKKEIIKLLDADMLETSMEVFMDDFSVFGDSFDSCLTNLEQMLIRCKQAHLVLNWEKYHFMVTEGIVLGHKVSRKGLEVDKAKIDVIAKLSPPINVKAVIKFDIKIKNKKGGENVTADHLSRLEKPNLKELKDEEINDEFPDEFLMSIKTDDEESPWFADFANYLHYFWVELYLFKAFPDSMIRRCVHGSETQKILDECHYGPSITTKKVFDVGFYCPTIFKEAQTLVQNCDVCQRSGSISRRDEMPLNNIQVSEIFDIWGIDFMRPFPKSHKFKFILVTIDYVSK
ncbi:reverse transcriptase domain-containing protein [Tanacetum coccineum]